jgi:uncharacterized protein YdeI (YjbR/CyaY-like superfamily)
MTLKPALQAASRKAWRAWLSKHHTKAQEIWLVYLKKHTGKPSVQYPESIEEALCFGWIDGIRKSIDDERYAVRFTPRRAGSQWSPRNIELAGKMIEAGKMTAAGREAFERRVGYGREIVQARSAREIPLTPALEQALRKNKKAWHHFRNLAPSHRKQYVGWLRSAKKPETREKRLREAIRLLARNEKLGMK